ncbi:MAG: hypothetical protein NVS3B7_11770 [Candidatus Elarobacter sp.]
MRGVPGLRRRVAAQDEGDGTHHDGDRDGKNQERQRRASWGAASAAALHAGEVRHPHAKYVRAAREDVMRLRRTTEDAFGDGVSREDRRQRTVVPGMGMSPDRLPCALTVDDASLRRGTA